MWWYSFTINLLPILSTGETGGGGDVTYISKFKHSHAGHMEISALYMFFLSVLPEQYKTHSTWINYQFFAYKCPLIPYVTWCKVKILSNPSVLRTTRAEVINAVSVAGDRTVIKQSRLQSSRKVFSRSIAGIRPCSCGLNCVCTLNQTKAKPFISNHEWNFSQVIK